MDRNKENLIAYLLWRGDLTFEQSPFNELDGLIFTQLVFFHFCDYIGNSKFLLKGALEMCYANKTDEDLRMGLVIPLTIIELGKLMMKSKRFENVMISNYEFRLDETSKEQFAAMCFHIDEKTIVISYQGTDDTLIGWQEDANMLSTFPVACQSSALSYFKKIAMEYPTNLFILVGHSKGGNLAMYAHLFAPSILKFRIVRTINYDGPGFEEKNIDKNNYLAQKDKITTIIPYGSVVGMLFNQFGTIKIVKSFARGLLQHDGFSWGVMGCQFIEMPKLRKENLAFSKGLNDLINSLNDDERESFCSSLDKYVKKTGAKTLMELNNNKIKIIQSMSAFTRNERQIFLRLLKLVIATRPF